MQIVRNCAKLISSSLDNYSHSTFIIAVVTFLPPRPLYFPFSLGCGPFTNEAAFPPFAYFFCSPLCRTCLIPLANALLLLSAVLYESSEIAFLSIISPTRLVSSPSPNSDKSKEDGIRNTVAICTTNIRIHVGERQVAYGGATSASFCPNL